MSTTRLRVHGGDWVPGAHNVALLLVQLIVLAQAALRGIDYLQPGQSSTGLVVIERALPLPWWGAAFLAATTLSLIGLAGRWASALAGGHLLIASLYLGLGAGILADGTGRPSVLIAPALLMGVGGTWCALHRSLPTVVRLLIGVPGMLTGQYLLSLDLGAGYRSGTGLIGAGLIHGILAVGTHVLWTRQRARAQVARERGVAPGAPR